MREFAYAHQQYSRVDAIRDLRNKGRGPKDVEIVAEKWKQMKERLHRRYANYVVMQSMKTKGGLGMGSKDYIVPWNAFGPTYVILTSSTDVANRSFLEVWVQATQKKIIHSYRDSNPVYVVSTISFYR